MDERQKSLEQLFVEAMRGAPARPRGMSEQSFAKTYLETVAVSALRRIEGEQAAKLAEIAARQATTDANTRYWTVNHYQGLRTSLRRGEEDAFCRWAGLRRKDFDKLAAGELPNVNDWTRDNDNPKQNTPGAQLIAMYRPPAQEPGDFALKSFGAHPPQQDSMRTVLGLVLVDWRTMTLDQAKAYATERRKGPSVAVVAGFN
jgi:hypothetical protein